MAYNLFKFQTLLGNLRLNAKKDSAKRKYLDDISPDATIEDMPFFKEYLSKFEIEKEFDGMELLTGLNVQCTNDDFDLFQRFVYGSFSCSYEFSLDETGNAVALIIMASNSNGSRAVRFHELWKIQLLKLFEVFLNEQINYDLNLLHDEERLSIVGLRAKKLKAFERKMQKLKGQEESIEALLDGDMLQNPDVKKMKVVVKDDEGCGMALMMDGYSQTQIQEAKSAIRKQFRDAALLVFAKVAGKNVPETIEIQLTQNHPDELSGKKPAILASFSPAMSDESHLSFTIRESIIKGYLTKKRMTLFQLTVIHEMMHAADLPMLSKASQLRNDIRNKIVASLTNPLNTQQKEPLGALLDVLNMLGVYRAEGVALLGEHLLSKQRFGSVDDAVVAFRKAYELTLQRSKLWINSPTAVDEIFDDKIRGLAYNVAPGILMLTLGRRGDLENELVLRTLEGMRSGDYELSDEETITILRAALSLSLIDYIQGLMLLGDKIAPMKPMLEFCALLQKEYEEENIAAFDNLIHHPELTMQAVKEIMGNFIPESEIDAYYHDFCQNTPDDGMQEKVAQLYEVMKKDNDLDRRRIAQWALTYLFDDQDLIHDDIPGLGLVDDMIVIDNALELLQRTTTNPI